MIGADSYGLIADSSREPVTTRIVEAVPEEYSEPVATGN
jgi:hypothetical protein